MSILSFLGRRQSYEKTVILQSKRLGPEPMLQCALLESRTTTLCVMLRLGVGFLGTCPRNIISLLPRSANFCLTSSKTQPLSFISLIWDEGRVWQIEERPPKDTHTLTPVLVNAWCYLARKNEGWRWNYVCWSANPKMDRLSWIFWVGPE